MSTIETSLGAVLSLTTGCLLAPLDEMYALQDFLSGEALMTHERIADEHDHAAVLLAMFPRLAEAEPPSQWERINGTAEAHCRRWVAEVAAHVGWHRTTIDQPTAAQPEGGAS